MKTDSSNIAPSEEERAANTAATGTNVSLDDPSTRPSASGKKHGKAALAVLACAAAVLFVFGAWSQYQYINGNDPLAILHGGKASDAAEQVVDEPEGAASASEAEADSRTSNASSGEADKDSKEAEEKDDAGESDEPANEAEADSASSGSGSGSAGGNDGSSALPEGGSSSSAAEDAGGDNGSSSQQAESAYITVNITIDGTAGGSNAASGSVAIPRGGTPYDALVASGASINARGTTFGTYVAAINGLAEKEHGSMSGWLYSVNGVEPQVACDQITLSDGDTVVWHYTAG